MTHQSRKPAIKLTVDKTVFNKIISLLDFNKNNLIDEASREKAIKLKNNLLKWSVPRVNEKNEEIADIRFFNSEAIDLFLQLFPRIATYIEQEDYFEVLKENRSKKEN